MAYFDKIPAVGTDATTSLPAGFEGLECWSAEWALPTEKERLLKRGQSTLVELKGFYEDILPRMPQIGEHFATKPVTEELDDSELRLFWLACSYIEISRCFEAWNAIDVRHDFFDPRLIDPGVRPGGARVNLEKPR